MRATISEAILRQCSAISDVCYTNHMEMRAYRCFCFSSVSKHLNAFVTLLPPLPPPPPLRSTVPLVLELITFVRIFIVKREQW